MGRRVGRRDLVKNLCIGLERHESMGKANGNEQLTPILANNYNGDMPPNVGEDRRISTATSKIPR